MVINQKLFTVILLTHILTFKDSLKKYKPSNRFMKYRITLNNFHVQLKATSQSKINNLPCQLVLFCCMDI